ncbi:10808_t:CDS:1, partial [Racocetra persica]
TKLSKKAYNLGQYGGDDNNKKDYNQYEQKLDYIIRFDRK